MSYAQNTTEFPNQPPLGHDELCTLSTCPTSRSIFKYQPNLPYAAGPLALFVALTIGHCIVGIRYRTWPFMVSMVIGSLLETLGYLGRTLGHYDPFKDTWYMLQISVLTFAPVFFCAAIYMSLSRIITIYGAHISRIKPVWYTRTFITFDVISLVIQAAGGGMAASATDPDGQALGINVMLGALCFQVVTLLVFSSLGIEFALCVRRNPDSVDMSTATLRTSWRWKGFLYAMITSTVLITIRSIYRVIEMGEGYNGPLIKNQHTFLVFEGILVVLAGGTLLAFHPGFSYAYMRRIQTRIRDSTEGIELMGPGKTANGGLSSRSS